MKPGKVVFGMFLLVIKGADHTQNQNTKDAAT